MNDIPQAYRTPHGLSDELRARLLQERGAIVATINPDGLPHLTEILFSLDDDDRVVIPTPHSTRKIKNVRARPHAAFFVTFGGSGWVSCTGSARVITGDEAARINQGIRDRLFTDAGHATLGRLLAAHEDCTIEITPRRWLSWDADVIVPAIVDLGGDLDAHPPEAWFRDLSADT